MNGESEQPSKAFVHSGDNIAISLVDLEPGTEIQVGESWIALRERVGFGHKFAIQDIPASEKIVKYGETIGIASKDIAAGEHVHVHNVQSLRGRAHE